MKKHLLFSLLVLCSFAQILSAQDNKQLAKAKAEHSIQLADDGKLDSAMMLMNEAISLDPTNNIYHYEIAYNYYQLKQYDTAAILLESLIKKPDAQDRYYQLLGNTYDFLHNPDKAIATYEKGLSKFPSSPHLNLERGIMYLLGEERSAKKAVTCFEKGVQGNPMFPSNYYWLAKTYCASSEKVWGLIYGELFINLEPTTQRTEEISALLFNTYKESITFKNDTSVSISFSKSVIGDPTKAPKKTMLFGILAYEPAIALSVIGEKNISLPSLARIRSRFIDRYYEQKLNEQYPNVLFDFHRDLKQAGHFEAYSNWVLLKGSENEFGLWQQSHQKEWEAFTKYYEEHLLLLNDKNLVYFGKY